MKFQTLKLFAGIVVLAVAAAFTSFQPASGLGLVFGQKIAGPAISSSPATPVSRAPVHPFEPSEELLYVAEFSRVSLEKNRRGRLSFHCRQRTIVAEGCGHWIQARRRLGLFLEIHR